MNQEIISTSSAPTAIGPYSQAIKHNGMVYVSGQIGMDPESGRLVSEVLEIQAEQALKNLAAILDAGGSSRKNVLKCSLFLIDMNDFHTVNKLYAKFFEDCTFPARETVQVSALPAGACFEISCIAVCN
jgi:2-iminobutanoate/2-iminopropanoate deaminase